MNPLVSRLQRIPVFVRLLAGSGVVVAALSLALAAPERPPQPAPPAPVVDFQRLRAEARPVAGPLFLTSLTVGSKPWLLAPGRRVASTFVTDDAESCRVTAAARLREGLDPRSIRWTVSTPLGFVVPVEGVWSGPKLDVVLRRPGGNPSGLGGPLLLTVQAQVEVDGEKYTAREIVIQDEIDQLRQEYIDLGRRTVPERSDFVNSADFALRFGSRYPWLRFEDLNWSMNPNTRQRFSYAIIQPELVEGLDRVRRAYGGVTINSGYRNPTRQVEVHAPVRESLHQYGYAVDLAVTPGDGRALPNEADWRRLAEIGCGARAKWVEPLTSSSPNSPGCHVHLDYRPGPVSSAPVGLSGQVVAADTGQPVPGALVLLGGMPAITNSSGGFGVRNVLSGGRYPVEVRADGYEPLVQPVALAAWGTVSTRLKLKPAALSTAVTAVVAHAGWTDRTAGLLAVALRVTNQGTSPVDDVKVSVAAVPAVVVSQTPPQLGRLPGGAVRGVNLLLRVGGRQPATLPFAIGLRFKTPEGRAERARFPLVASLPGVAPIAATPERALVSKASTPAPSRPAPTPPSSVTASEGPTPVTVAAPESPSPTPAKPAEVKPEPEKPKAPETPQEAKEPDTAPPAPAPAPASEPETSPSPVDEKKPTESEETESGKSGGAASGS